MGEQERGFLRAIIAAPDDDLPRLVFADWLDERGHHARAEFIRVQCELAGTGDASSFGYCRGTGSDLTYPSHPVRCGKCAPCLEWQAAGTRADALRSRERELWIDGLLAAVKPTLPLEMTLHRWEDKPSFTPSRPEGYVRRGFVEEVTLPWSRAHVAALRAATPLRKCVLTTWPRLEETRGGLYARLSDGSKELAYGAGRLWPYMTADLLAAEFPDTAFWLDERGRHVGPGAAGGDGCGGPPLRYRAEVVETGIAPTPAR
jgi:uncharacterized protein (TIGR02996 family)